MPISKDLVIACFNGDEKVKFLCKRLKGNKLKIVYTYSFYEFDNLYFDGMIVSNSYYVTRKPTKEEITEYLMRKL